MNLAFVALGANLPFGTAAPAATLQAVLPELARLSAAGLLVSPFYESQPKDCPPGSPLYVNAVVALVPQADETPESLLRKLQEIEAQHGRTRSGVVNEARTLDLDLLSFGEARRESTFLRLPHPRAQERRFVLEPWRALMGGDWLFEGATLAQWLATNTDPPLQRLA